MRLSEILQRAQRTLLPPTIHTQSTPGPSQCWREAREKLAARAGGWAGRRSNVQEASVTRASELEQRSPSSLLAMLTAEHDRQKRTVCAEKRQDRQRVQEPPAHRRTLRQQGRRRLPSRTREAVPGAARWPRPSRAE